MGSYQPVIKRIAIVGAGPIGLTCAKHLRAEQHFDRIDIFEQRSQIGGIWNLTGADRSKRISIPQMNPQYGTLGMTNVGDHKDANGFPDSVDPLEFETPLYDHLETNIPKQLMAYSDKPFAKDLPLFPGHRDVLEYLEEYARGVKNMIRFETRVEDAKPITSADGQDLWRVTLNDLQTGNVTTSEYDAIVAANGHYTVPRVPDILGIRRWNEAYPGAILHSKAYRLPQDFKNKTVVVVGNSASGLDIAGQLAPFCKHPIHLSSRSSSPFAGIKSPSWRKDIDELVEFLNPQERSCAVQTKTGEIIEHIDYVLFATGYFYSYPFLSSLDPPIITDGFRVKDIYQHFLNINHPTLALPVLNLKVIPFPLVENQAAVLARIWSGRLPTPSQLDMRTWEEQELQNAGSEKYFHLKKFPGDALQINDLYQWAASATPRQGLENDGNGKLGTSWNERQIWMRSKFMEIKMAFNGRGEQRNQVRTIEDLGFNFDRWKQNAKPEELEMFQRGGCLDINGN